MELSLFNLVLVLATALVAGRLAARLGYPSILGELLAGILLGPPLLGLLVDESPLHLLGEVGVLLMMLYIGMHIDLGDLWRASRAGLLAAAGGFLVPSLLGIAAVLAFGGTLLAGVFVGLAMGVTSLATKSRILVDLRILDTRVAHVLMAGALFSDLAVLVIFAGIVGLVPEGMTTIDGGSAVGEITLVVAKALLFLIVAYVVGSRVLPLAGRLLRRTAAGDRTFLFLAVVLIGFAFAELAEVAGLHAILGAFLAGLFVDESVIERKMLREVERLVFTVSIGFLAPVFFVTAGFAVTFDVFRTDLPLLITVLVLATVGKIVGTTVFYFFSGNGWREGIAVGTGMNGRGAVEIIVAEIALTRGLISQEIFSILVFMALATTASVPVLLTLAIRWLDRRNELVRPNVRTGAVIAGAGPVARRLARSLGPMPVTLVDTNPHHGAVALREGLSVVTGSGLDEDVLARAGIGSARWFVALTANASVNVLAAQVAVAAGVPQAYVSIGTHDPHHLAGLLREAGAVRLFASPVDLTSWDYGVTHGEVAEIVIEVGDDVEDDLLEAAATYDGEVAGRLPLLVVRGEERTLVAAVSDVRPGDRLVALAREGPDSPDEPGASSPVALTFP